MTYAAQPPDEDHAYGHEKANYLSAGIEGTMIVIAAVVILVTAGARLFDPSPIDDAAVGIAVALVASVINGLVGKLLLDEGRKHRSLVVEADGRHLLTDVVTSVGVAIGVAAVVISGVDVLDPVIALLVGLNIIRTGAQLIRRSLDGVLDRALTSEEIARAEQVLDGFRSDEVDFHAMRTRRAGSRAFVSIHVLVPGSWSVAQGHELLEEVEASLRATLEPAYVFTHLEPREDPKSFEDIELDRGAAGA